MGIFVPETMLEATDSDPRLQVFFAKTYTNKPDPKVRVANMKASGENRPSPQLYGITTIIGARRTKA